MDISVVSPIKAYISGCNSNEILELRKNLSYRNTAAYFEYKKHLDRDWQKNKDPSGWEAKKRELEASINCCLLYSDKDGYWIRPGSIPYLQNIDKVTNNIAYSKFEPLSWIKRPEFELYPYQKLSIEKLIDIKHGCIELATGAGKTAILQNLCQQIGNVVVVTPSASIFNEILDNFKESFGSDIVGGYGDGHKDIGNPITIAISKSLTMLEEDSKASEFFKKKKALIVDECFVNRTPIITDKGVVEIGKIHRDRLLNIYHKYV